MGTQYTFPYWNASVRSEKFDVVRGLSATDSTYFYATRSTLGERPVQIFSYSTMLWNREDDLVTVYYSLTGSDPQFVPGSIIVAAGGLINGFTGMIVNAGNLGTSGFVQFIHPGWTELGNTAAGTISTTLSPAWTTGFYFIPSYNTTSSTEPNIIETKFGDGYSQRQAQSLNNNNVMWDLNFEGRSDKEARAISNFIQDKQGVYSFELMLPVSKLANRTDLKYIGKSVRVSTNSYGLNNITVNVQQVFDLD